MTFADKNDNKPDFEKTSGAVSVFGLNTAMCLFNTGGAIYSHSPMIYGSFAIVNAVALTIGTASLIDMFANNACKEFAAIPQPDLVSGRQFEKTDNPFVK